MTDQWSGGPGVSSKQDWIEELKKASSIANLPRKYRPAEGEDSPVAACASDQINLTSVSMSIRVHKLASKSKCTPVNKIECQTKSNSN